MCLQILKNNHSVAFIVNCNVNSDKIFNFGLETKN